MTRSEACALSKGDYVRFGDDARLLLVVQPARPKYVLLRAHDGATEIPHVEYMTQYVKVTPLKLSEESVIIPLNQSGEAEVES